MLWIPILDDPEDGLERALMEEYLSEQGYSFEDVESLDDDDREDLMREAAAYAAIRLAERAYEHEDHEDNSSS
jgi:hypothetical protein